MTASHQSDRQLLLSQPDVSAVIPVFRNADTLEGLYRRLTHTFESQQMDFEIIFVDDACPAGSLGILKILAQRDARVMTLALKENVGQHAAILTGLAYACGKWSIIMDADLQDPPEAIPALLTKGEEGFAAVFGGRRGRYESHDRLFTSRLFKWLQHLLTGVPIDAGTFVAISSSMREYLLKMGVPFASIVMMIGCTGLPLASVPVYRSSRPTGSSAYSAWGRLRSGLRAILWVFHWRLRKITGMVNNSQQDKFISDRRKAVRIAEFIGYRFKR